MSQRHRLGGQVVEGGRGDYPDKMSREKTPQTDTRRSDCAHYHCMSFIYVSPSFLRHFSDCRPCVLCRATLSTPATPAATPCPVTPPAATATSAGLTEGLEESAWVAVASVTRLTLTPTSSTRGAPTTAALTPLPTTTTLDTETFPTASHTTSLCTAPPPTVASRNCLWGGAAAEKPGDESRHPSYQPQPIRQKAIGQGHFPHLVPVPIKWMLSNPGNRRTH